MKKNSHFLLSLIALPAVAALIGFSKKIHLPGFENLSLYEVLKFFIIGLRKGGLKMRASSMAYHFFLALFPMIIFLFTLIPYVPISNFQNELMVVIKSLLPANAYSLLEDTISEIVLRQNSGLLSFGFLAALYFSTSGFMSMMSAFNNSIHISEYRAEWKQQFIALIMVIILAAAMFVGISLIVYSEVIIAKLVKKTGTEYLLITMGRWLLLGLIFMMVIGMFYRLGPSRKMHKNLISPGTLLATALIIITSIGIAWFVNNFGNYNKLYGSIGTVLVILMWIYWNSMMLLIGFELDAGIASANKNKKPLLEQAIASEENGKTEESNVKAMSDDDSSAL